MWRDRPAEIHGSTSDSLPNEKACTCSRHCGAVRYELMVQHYQSRPLSHFLGSEPIGYTSSICVLATVVYLAPDSKSTAPTSSTDVTQRLVAARFVRVS